MTFEFKPERIPKIFDQRIANEVYDLFPEFPENLRNFFAATASCSPFLFSQIQNERDWLVDVIKEKEFDLLSLLHPLKSSVRTFHHHPIKSRNLKDIFLKVFGLVENLLKLLLLQLYF